MSSYKPHKLYLVTLTSLWQCSQFERYNNRSVLKWSFPNKL